MLRLAKQEETEEILAYLEQDLGNCIYLYMDIKKYGLSDNHIKVWVNEEKPITTVIMRYFDSLQIYGDVQEADITGIYKCILNENVQMISGKKILVDKLKTFDNIAAEYDCKDGSVFIFENYRTFSYKGIERAGIEDCAEIATLICTDGGFAGNYEEEGLACQLRDRLKSGMGRNYIIRKDGKIIAHIATFAENMGIAVTSGLIVDAECREYPYGAMMESYLVNELKKEKFRIYTFVNDRKRIKMLRAMGTEECGQYEKLMKRRS